MDEQTAIPAEAAKSSASKIVSLVDLAMAGADGSVREAAIEEAQETILALIAAVIAADGATAHQEFVFAALITKDLRDSLRCRAYLNDYAQRWTLIAGRTPAFLSAAIDYDVSNGTKICPAILAEFRTLVRHTAGVDGELVDSEVHVADNLLSHVDALFRQARWTVKWEENSLPSIQVSRTIARDDLPNREII